MSASGHEAEFRRLFEEEARTRLAQLAELALELEGRGAAPAVVDAMFRHAHTVKGGAGVVGFPELSAVVHDLEELIEDVREGRRPPSGEVADAILGVVDALQDMIPRAVAGQDQEGPRMAAQAALARAGDLIPAAPSPSPAPAAPPGGEPGPIEPRRMEDAGGAIPVPVERLDELVRLVGEGAAAQLRVGRLLSERLGGEPTVMDEYRDLARVIGSLQEQAMRARMVSVAMIAGPLRRAARDQARAAGKQVRWELLGEDTQLDRHVLERLREPLVALVRNAVDHGLEPTEERIARGKDPEGLVRIHAMQVGADVIISVSDDGRGIDPARVGEAIGRTIDEHDAFAAIFRPGVSTAARVTGVSGRGVGLDAVRQAVDELRGRIEVHSAPGAGTEFRISVPMTLAILRCLVLRAGSERFAIPLPAIVGLLRPGAAGEMTVEGRAAVWFGGDAVALSDLATVLGAADAAGDGPVVVVTTTARRHAFRVSELLAQRDVVVKELGRVLPRLELVAGAGVEADGSILLVLDAGGLVDAAARAPVAAPAGPEPRQLEPPAEGARLLVVDDATTVRELQRSILERAGFDVVVAESGQEALARLAEHSFDLVLTDVEMPGMDGFELTRAIRASTEHRHLPVVVLTSRAGDEDRRRGMEAGADSYLVKSAFDEHALLTAVRRLLGEPRGGEGPT